MIEKENNMVDNMKDIIDDKKSEEEGASFSSNVVLISFMI